MMKTKLLYRLVMTAACAVSLAACGVTGPAAQDAAAPGMKTIVVTYSILGAVVKDLVGDKANVIVPMPNGQDPHEWEPSAKDIEIINKADLVVQNGLGLEGGMEKTLLQARDAGVDFFTASDAITVRKVGPGEGLPSGDPDQAVGADDPHLWMDPTAMKAVELALATKLKADLGIDVTGRAQDLANRLDSLDKEVAGDVAALPAANRRLVTGHESMGYFAQHYGFKLVGAIVPSITTQAEVSASDLAALKKLIQMNHVNAVFTELGTSPAVAEAIGKETGVKVVQLTTHMLPDDGSYFTFMRDVAKTIVDALK
ncbi:MAG: metal ABC transporter substrate-binding protein [Chloroflexi bacterium]|nr:metal ABC transporter substrate-binding protein [Chloroflexota bacterium]